MLQAVALLAQQTAQIQPLECYPLNHLLGRIQPTLKPSLPEAAHRSQRRRNPADQSATWLRRSCRRRPLSFLPLFARRSGKLGYFLRKATSASWQSSRCLLLRPIGAAVPPQQRNERDGSILAGSLRSQGGSDPIIETGIDWRSGRLQHQLCSMCKK